MENDGFLKFISKEEEARFYIETIKYMIRSEDYEGARHMAKEALKLSPPLQNGNQILTITEILFYADFVPPDDVIDWYGLLQLTPSSTESELKSRCEDFIKVIETPMEVEFPGIQSALALVKEAMSVLCNERARSRYDLKRKALWCFNDKPLASSAEVMCSGFKDYDLSLFYSSLQPKYVHHQVFGDLPQNPHYKPLSNYSMMVQNGMKLGLDYVFINLSLKIQKLRNPQQYWTEIKHLNAQVTDLDKIGYNVVKQKERLDTLGKIAHKYQLEQSKMRIMEIRAASREGWILKTKIRQLEKRLAAQISEVEGFKSAAKRIKEDSSKTLNEFSSVAQSSSWK